MTADERDAAEDDYNDAVQDALADLGGAVREAVEARQTYERAIAAVDAAGARMTAAAAIEERALEVLRALHGAPVHTPEPPSNAGEITTYSRGRRPSPRSAWEAVKAGAKWGEVRAILEAGAEAPDACALRLFDHHDRDGHWWRWWCSQHEEGDGDWRTREEAEAAFNEHQAEVSAAPVACTPEVEPVHLGWQWRCSRHDRVADGYSSRDSAQQGAADHQAEFIGR